jgi:hypothetical protein
MSRRRHPDCWEDPSTQRPVLFGVFAALALSAVITVLIIKALPQ